MGSRRSAWGGVLVALLATGAPEVAGQEARRIRLALKDGAVVEGRLEGYADRTYRVQLADGTTREVKEREVNRVDFEPGAAAAPAGVEAVLAEVVGRAASSGAFARRLAGRLLLACVQEDVEQPGAPRLRRELLVAVTARVDAAAGLLVVDVESRAPAGQESDLALLADVEAKGPARYRWSLGLADGRLRRLEAWSARVDLDLRLADGKLRLAQRTGDQVREGEGPAGPAFVPLELLAFVLAPLHDQGLPASLAVPLVRGRAGARLRLLPAAPGDERTVEIAQERDAEPTGDLLRVVVGAAGVVRLDGVLTVHRDGVRVAGKRLTAERLSREAWDARAAAWGTPPPPTGPTRPGAAPPPAGQTDAPDPVAALLAAARADGALARLAGERWLATRRGDGVVSLERAVWVSTEAEATFELHHERIGDPAAASLQTSTWDAAGRLLRVRERRTLRGLHLDAEGRVEAGRLVVRRTLSVEGLPPHTEELAQPLPAGALLESAARVGLPALALPARLDVTVLRITEVEGLETSGLALEPCEGGVRVTSRSLRGGGTSPRWLVAVGPDGVRSVGRDPALRPAWPPGQPEKHDVAWDVDPDAALAVTADEASALRADAAVLAAGQREAREEAERLLGVALEKLHRAQTKFRATDADHDGVSDFAADLAELGRAGLIDLALQSGLMLGHRITLGRAQDAPEERWLAVADPVDPTSGARSLAITQEGVVLVGPGPFAPLPADARAPAGASPREAR